MNCTLRSTDGHDGACLQHLHFSGQAIVQLLMMILIKEGPNQMATDPTPVNRKIPHMVLRRKKGLRIKQSWGLEMTSDSKDRKLHIVNQSWILTAHPLGLFFSKKVFVFRTGALLG